MYMKKIITAILCIVSSIVIHYSCLIICYFNNISKFIREDSVLF